MNEKTISAGKKSLFFIGMLAVLGLIGMPVQAAGIAGSDSSHTQVLGLSSAFLTDYGSSGLTLPSSPTLGTASLLSGLPSFSSGTGTLLPGTGSSSGTMSLISNALNNYKTTPTAFRDYSYISSYIPTCYGV